MWWKSPLPMKTTGGSARSDGSSSTCSRRSTGRRQANRTGSSQWRRGIVSAPSKGRTDPSKSRISVRDMSGVPLTIGLEQALEQPEKRSHHGIADVDGVKREREARAEVALDLRIGPAGHVVPEIPLQRVFEVVKPTDGIKIVFACLGIGKTDVLVYEHPVLADTEVVAEEDAAGAVDKDDPVDAGILQYGAEERRGQQIEVDLALRVHVPVEGIQRCQKHLVLEAVGSGWDRLHLQRCPAPEFPPHVPAPGVRQTLQVFVRLGEVDRNVRERLPFDEHEPFGPARPGETGRVRLLRFVDQRRV